MSTTYTIADGNVLVELFHGIPADSWEFSEPAAEIESVTVGDFGGQCFCDVLVLSDGRTILKTVSGPIWDESPRVYIYPSLDDAWGDINGTELQPQVEQ